MHNFTDNPTRSSELLQGFTGLTNQQVIDRRNAGQGNNVAIQTSRTYWDIVRENLLTFINIVFLVLGLILISLGSYGDAFLVVVVLFGGVVVSVCQELWAKQKLDKIAILTRPKAIALRGRRLIEIDPSEIVLGDLLEIQSGDQVVVDGEILGSGAVDIDEALLTGAPGREAEATAGWLERMAPYHDSLMRKWARASRYGRIVRRGRCAKNPPCAV